MRIRVGVGKPQNKNLLIEHVISKTSVSEYNELEIGIDKAVLSVIEIVKNDINTAMNKFN